MCVSVCVCVCSRTRASVWGGEELRIRGRENYQNMLYDKRIYLIKISWDCSEAAILPRVTAVQREVSVPIAQRYTQSQISSVGGLCTDLHGHQPARGSVPGVQPEANILSQDTTDS